MMADKYIKLDTVLRLIERVKDNYKENRDECPINYGTMVGLEVELNTGELFTEQEIVNPCLDKIRAEIGKSWHKHPKNRYEEGLKDQALKDMQIIDKYKAEREG